MKVSLEQAFQKLRNSESPFEQVMANGSMTVEIYKPKQVDLQLPHTQDELYIVISGTGSFYNDLRQILYPWMCYLYPLEQSIDWKTLQIIFRPGLYFTVNKVEKVNKNIVSNICLSV